MKYYRVTDGEWVWIPRTHKMSCCDCGLTHTFSFRTRRGRLYYKAVRHVRATAVRRSRNRFPFVASRRQAT